MGSEMGMLNNIFRIKLVTFPCDSAKAPKTNRNLHIFKHCIFEQRNMFSCLHRVPTHKHTHTQFSKSSITCQFNPFRYDTSSLNIEPEQPFVFIMNIYSFTYTRTMNARFLDLTIKVVNLLLQKIACTVHLLRVNLYIRMNEPNDCLSHFLYLMCMHAVYIRISNCSEFWGENGFSTLTKKKKEMVNGSHIHKHKFSHWDFQGFIQAKFIIISIFRRQS